MEYHTVHESQFLKGKDFYFFILDKTESMSGLHEHDYYEFTLILNGLCSQNINGKRVELSRGDLSLFQLDPITRRIMTMA